MELRFAISESSPTRVDRCGSAIQSLNSNSGVGDLLRDDDSIHVYNTANGTQQRTLLSKKYGVGCICFTHHTNAIICGSKNNSWDETLRYLSLHDNSMYDASPMVR
eukprot:4066552-Pyramimonas_sp.AAC.2